MRGGMSVPWGDMCSRGIGVPRGMGVPGGLDFQGDVVFQGDECSRGINPIKLDVFRSVPCYMHLMTQELVMSRPLSL